MKYTTLLMILATLSLNVSADFAGFFNGDKESIRLKLNGDQIIIKAHISKPDYESFYNSWTVELENISPSVEGLRNQKLFLKPEFGHGDSPLNKVCEEVGRMIGKPEIKFASAGGYQLETFNVFARPTFLVINMDDSYNISTSEPNGGYYVKGLSCTSVYLEY